MTVLTTPIADAADLALAYRIRTDVFVTEQRVPADQEFEHEEVSRHFLAWVDGQPAGTARWRVTACGVKLERFAVQKPFRAAGVGRALMQALLNDIRASPTHASQLHYLHAQVVAIPFYTRFGFQPVGAPFDECNIVHSLMEWQPPVTR